MKSFVGILALVALVAYASGAAMPEYIEDGPLALWGEAGPGQEEPAKLVEAALAEEGQVSHSRQRRFTCDVFSFSSAWATPNHSACALKCVGKGRKGGHCENNNCICRDDKYIG